MTTATAASPPETLARLCGARPELAAPPALLVLAHPDDETVGAASLLPRLTLARLVYVTDGAPRDGVDAASVGCATIAEYASRRRGELLSALQSVGIAPERIEFLEGVDQETVLQLATLTQWIEILIRDHCPVVVITHPYEGGHPDHDATAFAVHRAQQRIAAAGESAPLVVEFTSYHLRDGAWEFGAFLPNGRDSIEIVRRLSAAERALKRTLLGCYASQRDVLRNVPLESERFRLAPNYDFSAPPHPGPLLYERYGWGINGAEWRRHAQSVLAETANPEISAHDTAGLVAIPCR